MGFLLIPPHFYRCIASLYAWKRRLAFCSTDYSNLSIGFTVGFIVHVRTFPEVYFCWSFYQQWLDVDYNIACILLLFFWRRCIAPKRSRASFGRWWQSRLRFGRCSCTLVGYQGRDASMADAVSSPILDSCSTWNNSHETSRRVQISCVS